MSRVLRPHHGMCFQFYEGKACGLAEGDDISFAEFTELVRDKIIDAGIRSDICGDCSWDYICREKERILRAVRRISEMEAILDEALRRLDKAEEEPEALLTYQLEIKKLDEYYSSQDWKDDYAMDDEGLLPKELKRGVLSEDGIWNLLTDCKELKERMRELGVRS